VRNLGEEFLPPHLVYLGSYFRRRRMNALFPVSVVASALVTVVLVADSTEAQGAARTGLLLVASLLALATIEHLFMVVPIPPSILWRWALRNPAPSSP
jgi:putative photosynthetic complex assembly protein 2